MSVGTIIIYVAGMLVVAIVLNLGGWWLTVRLFDRVGKKLRFASFVAVRHLKGRKSGFLAAIGVLSILGVSFSSCTLTTVLSVMGGFSGDLKEKILKTNAHIVVDNKGGDMENWRPVLEKVRGVEGVLAATPLLKGDMMMNARTNNQPIMLKGIDLSSFCEVSSVLNSLEEGSLDYMRDPLELFKAINAKRRRLYADWDAGAPPGKDTEKSSEIKGTLDEGSEEVPSSASSKLSAKIRTGQEIARPRQKTLSAVVVGRELARSLRLYVGEEVNIINPIGGIGPTGPIPKSRPFRVGGVFFSGMFDFDSVFAYMSLEAAQKYLNKPGRISEIQIAVSDPEAARKTAERVSAALGEKWRVRSWAELNAPLFSALKLEKIVMFIFLSMAILVASFCIIATLTMLVLEKGAEVSILMTLGATPREIRNIFRFEGLLIGLVGTASGLLVGFGLCTFLETVGLPIDPEVWYIDTLPVDMQLREFFLVGLASVVITQLATIYPARAAARLTPIEGLSNE